MKYTVNKLINQLEKGEKLGFLFFWGHRLQKDGSVGKGCLSQWYSTGFTYEKQYYRTAEHWMMAEKAAIFGDLVIEKQILKSQSPNEAKLYGRKVSNFNVEKWEKIGYSIVVQGNLLKFGQNHRLKHFLLSTSDKVLVEASPNDKYWGIALLETDSRVESPKEWAGENKLGFALMEVRDKLRGSLAV